MNNVKQFVAEARSKGLHDEQIKQLLINAGWAETEAQVAVLDLSIPSAPHTAQDTSSVEPSQSQPHANVNPHTKVNDKSISALEAALQHVLLWVFTITTSIMIGVVSYELFGARSGSSETLLTYLVLEVFTFIPFAILFSNYLKKFRKQSDLKTGKVWSIITIVLHSLGLIGALATFVLVLVLVDGGDDTTALLVSSAAIATMNALVVSAYVIANFVKPTYAWRKKVLPLFPILLLVLISIFGILALVRVGPLRADDQTRKQLVSIVKAIREEAKSSKSLPATLQDVDANTVGVSYAKQTNTKYQLCADFNKGIDSGYDRGNYDIDDTYISTYDFEAENNGQQCFTIKATSLIPDPYRLYPDTSYDSTTN